MFVVIETINQISIKMDFLEPSDKGPCAVDRFTRYATPKSATHFYPILMMYVHNRNCVDVVYSSLIVCLVHYCIFF